MFIIKLKIVLFILLLVHNYHIIIKIILFTTFVFGTEDEFQKRRFFIS